MMRSFMRSRAVVVIAAILVLVTGVRAVFPTWYWFEPRSMHVAAAVAGQPVAMAVDRIIRRPFTGQWSVTVRRATPSAGWEIVCAASGGGDYRPDAVFPDPLTLDWWTAGACDTLPPGQMQVSTVWWLDMGILGAIPTRPLESNVFTVSEE